MNELIKMLKELEATHCSCDLMVGWTCSIHQDIRKIILFIERELGN